MYASALHYDYLDGKCYVIAGEHFMLDHNQNHHEAIDAVEGIFVSLLWEIWEVLAQKYPETSCRSNVNPEAFHEYIIKCKAKMPYMDIDLEAKFSRL